jgi:hypothetical protein
LPKKWLGLFFPKTHLVTLRLEEPLFAAGLAVINHDEFAIGGSMPHFVGAH